MTDDAMTRTLQLVQQAQGGNHDALNRLFGRYYERVRRSVRARIGPKLRSHLETGDILQQTFAKAFEKFDQFEMRDEGSLVHWLAQIAEGQIRDVVDHLGARKRTPPGPLVQLDAPVGDASGRIGENVPNGQEPLTSALVRNFDVQVLEECLDQLAPQHRAVIVYRDFEGLEWQDVATHAGRPSASAAREMHRAATLELAKLLRRRGVGRES